MGTPRDERPLSVALIGSAPWRSEAVDFANAAERKIRVVALERNRLRSVGRATVHILQKRLDGHLDQTSDSY